MRARPLVMMPATCAMAMTGPHCSPSRHLALFAALAALGLAAPAASAAKPFAPAETLSYNVRCLGVPAGKAQLVVGAQMSMSGQSVWPVMLMAKTDALFALYPLKNQYVTWWSPEKQTTLGNELKAEERSQRRRERVRFLRADGRATTLREGEGRSPVDASYEIPADAQDMLSAVLMLRGKRLAVGDVENVPVFTGKRLFTLRAAVDRRETITVPAGTFETVAIKIQLELTGNLKSKRDLLLWVTDDERHVPVRLDAEFAFGSVVADLASYQRGIESYRR